MEQGYNRKEHCGSKQYRNYYERGIYMIVVGIDVAKDKHDCFVMNSEGEVLFNPFVIQNNREGFDSLYEKICSVANDFTKVKVGLEATGHYSYN